MGHDHKYCPSKLDIGCSFLKDTNLYVLNDCFRYTCYYAEMFWWSVDFEFRYQVDSVKIYESTTGKSTDLST